MSNVERFILVLLMMSATVFTRFFVLLINKKEKSKRYESLIRNLPYATMGLLVVYGLKDSLLLQSINPLYELVSLILITVVYYMSHHVLISVSTGLALYLILVNLL